MQQPKPNRSSAAGGQNDSRPELGTAGLPPHDWVTSVYEQRQTALVSYTTMRLRGQREEACDIVQEAFVKLCLQSWPDIQTHAVAWLYATCRNRAIDFLRKEKRMRTSETKQRFATDQLEDSNGPAPEEGAMMSEQLTGVREGIRQLAPKQQELLRLRLHDGLSYKEIANVTGLSVSNVGFQLHDALRRLRQRLRPIGG